jgi:predicted PurR-regulated permease PerM
MAEPSPLFNGGRIQWRPLLGAAGTALLLYGAWRFRALIAYMLIAVALSFVGRPLVLAVQRIRLRGKPLTANVGALVALCAMAAIAAAAAAIVVPIVWAQIETLSTLDTAQIQRMFESTMAWMDTDFPIALDPAGGPNSAYIVQELHALLTPDLLGGMLGDAVAFAGQAAIAASSVLFMTYFFLRDGALFRNILFAVTPTGMEDRMSTIVDRTSQLLTRYFLGLILQVAIVSAIVTGGLWIIGVPNALLIGTLAGLFNLVPYVGPIAGAAVGLLLIATGWPGDAASMQSAVAWSAAVFGLAQIVDNWFTQPVIFANSVHAHPLEIFILLSVAGSLGGPVGMVLAIPGYTLLRIVAKELLSGFKIIDRLTSRL